MNEPTRLIPYNHNWTDEYPSLDREAFRWWHWVWALTLALPLVLGMLALGFLAVLVVFWGNCRAWLNRRRIERLALLGFTAAAAAIYIWSGVLVREFELESRWIIGNAGMDRLGSSPWLWPSGSSWLALTVASAWVSTLFWGVVWLDDFLPCLESKLAEPPSPTPFPVLRELWWFAWQFACTFGALFLAWWLLGKFAERIY